MNQVLRSQIGMVWIETASRLGMGLIVFPIAISVFSDAELSLWLLFNAIIALSALSDSGLGAGLLRASAYFMSGAKNVPLNFDPLAEQKPERSTPPNWLGVRTLIATTQRLYAFIGLATFALATGAGGALIWNIQRAAGNQTELWVAFAFVVVWTIVENQNGRWSSILQGIGKLVLEKRISTVASMVKITVISLLLLFGYGLMEVTLAGAIITGVNYFALRGTALSSVPQQSSMPAKFDRGLFLAIWPASWRTGISNWGAYFVYTGSSFIVAQLDDLTLVASYLVTLRISFMILQVARAPMAAYLPRLIAAFATGDQKQVRMYTLQLVTLGISVFVVGFVVVAVFGNHLLDLNDSDFMLVGNRTLFVIALILLLELHHSIHASIYIATNRMPFMWAAILSGGSIICIGFFVLPEFGLMGYLLVQFTIQAAFNNWYPVRLSLGLTNWQFKNYVASIIKFPTTIYKKWVVSSRTSQDT